LSQELIGEFTGKNVVYRVLPDGKIETTNQGTGKILGADAFVMSTAVGSMENGSFVGEVNSLISTVGGDSVILKGNAVSGQSDKGITTRAASCQMTKSEKFVRLNKSLLLHEYITDMEGNWTGKIWEWK
jgi:hypothetical protein